MQLPTSLTDSSDTSDEAQLPVIRMQPAAIGTLRYATNVRWRQALLAAGLLSEVAETSDPDDPRAWILAVQVLLLELTMLEEERDSLRALDHRAGVHDAPWWMWALLLLQPWLAVHLGRNEVDHFDRFITMLWVYLIPAIVAAGIGIGIGVVIFRRKAARKVRLRELDSEIAQTRAELAEGASRTLARDFATLSGQRLLVNTPSLDPYDTDGIAAMGERIVALQRTPPDTWTPLDP